MRVAVIFGGRSAEHEVSVASARSVVAALRLRHEVACIYVDRAGAWHLVEDVDRAAPSQGHLGVLSIGSGPCFVATLSENGSRKERDLYIDVAFPLIHGPYGEDGRLQGLLDMAGIPYIGCGVASSAVAMDKAMCKAVLGAAGLPQVPYLTVQLADWRASTRAILDRVADSLGVPVFVKPANLGSSVGVTRAENLGALKTALDEAFRYDRKAVVERAVVCRELECGILGHSKLRPSVVGEVRPKGPFYDYESKYSPGGSELLIPAPVPEEVADRVKELALASFREIGGSGMARVDFFYQETTGQIYVNEINTIPGFTATSMYPKLFEASGIAYADLLDQLILAALERHADLHT